jgi:hypothetical protein
VPLARSWSLRERSQAEGSEWRLGSWASIGKTPKACAITHIAVLLWASKRKVFPFKVFIYDPCATGYHTAFLRVLLATIGAKSGWRVTILTSEDAERHPAFRRLCEEFRNKLDIVVAHEVREPPFVGRLLGSFYAEQYANFKSLKRERSFDFALVPYMEP